MRTAMAVSGFYENVCVVPAQRIARFVALLRRSGQAAAQPDAHTLAQAPAD